MSEAAQTFIEVGRLFGIEPSVEIRADSQMLQYTALVTACEAAIIMHWQKPDSLKKKADIDAQLKLIARAGAPRHMVHPTILAAATAVLEQKL